MKLLESQRIKRESANESSGTSKEVNEATNLSSAIKPTLVKQVLLRNSKNSSSTSATSEAAKAEVNTSKLSEHPKPHKANVLKTYESLYVKIG